VAVNVPTPAINAAMKVRTKNNRIPRTSIVMTLGLLRDTLPAIAPGPCAVHPTAWDALSRRARRAVTASRTRAAKTIDYVS
jgi:hypothetical protein